MASKLTKTLSCIAIGSYLTSGVLAQEFKEDSPDYAKPTARYDRVLDDGETEAPGLVSEAQSAVRVHDYDRALELAKEAISDRADDLDLHKIMAQAFEGKLEKQDPKQPDPYIKQRCVEEWLCVMRSGVGEDAGLNVHGAGYIEDYLFKDDDRYILAKKHLVHVAGYAPKPFETNLHYMKRVLGPSLRGTLMTKNNASIPNQTNTSSN